MSSSSPDDIDHEAEALEVLLRTWLDDDDAADLVGMIVEESESVMSILYEQWPHRHDEAGGKHD